MCTFIKETLLIIHSLTGAYSRIDLIFSDFNLLRRTISVTIHSITWSDHTPVSIVLKEQNSVPPTYLWRNNTELLAKPILANKMNQQLSEFFSDQRQGQY